jgi:prevent-host-death family protein
MMEQIGVNNAKTHLSELVAQVREGQEFTITHRGVPVARLVPVATPTQNEAQAAYERALLIRKKWSLQGLKIRDLIKKGRDCRSLLLQLLLNFP